VSDSSSKASTPAKKIKVVVGLPTAGFTQPEALNCLWLHAFHLGKHEAMYPEFEFSFCPRGRMFTPMNREVILLNALDAKADYLMMIDDDMAFSQDLFEKLYRHHVDIVAPLAFTRNPPYLPVLYQGDYQWDPIEKKEGYIFGPIKNYPRNKLVEVDAVGFGAVLIDLKIVPKMQAPFFMCSSGTGEDINFCLKAKQAGARVFCDTSTKLGHFGSPILITEETNAQYNDPEMMEKMYGPYKKYEVLEICHETIQAEPGEKEPLLAR
jgi:hypothetical protein